MNKPALGRGLKALIPQSEKNEETSTRQSATVGATNQLAANEISVSQIDKNPQQPRQHFDQQQLDELVQSIRQYGIIQPLVVSQVGNKYELITGERRWRAAKILNLKTVPAIIRPAEEQEKLELALIENIQREDLNAVEEARAYQRLIDEFDLTVEKVAKKVGKPRPTVSNILRLLRLPEEVQRAIVKGKISASHGKAIASLKDETEQTTLFNKIVRGQINVADANKAARRVVVSQHLRKIKTSPDLMAKEELLQNQLGTKVKITERANRGQIKIDFYSLEELNEVVGKIIK